jgi:hypothetical protein
LLTDGAKALAHGIGIKIEFIAGRTKTHSVVTIKRIGIGIDPARFFLNKEGTPFRDATEIPAERIFKQR